MSAPVKNKTTKELKKGDVVLLAYGEQFGDLARCDTFASYMYLLMHSSYKAWTAEIYENKEYDKGTTRMCTVFGFETETGSVYCHDIIGYKDEDGFFQPIDHTQAQLELKKNVCQ